MKTAPTPSTEKSILPSLTLQNPPQGQELASVGMQLAWRSWKSLLGISQELASVGMQQDGYLQQHLKKRGKFEKFKHVQATPNGFQFSDTNLILPR